MGSKAVATVSINELKKGLLKQKPDPCFKQPIAFVLAFLLQIA